MQLIVVVNCTAKKTAPFEESLRGASLPSATLPELVTEWQSRVERAADRFPASALYGGRAFSLAWTVAQSIAADFYIMSAGMGLVRHNTLIPAYSLSVTPHTTDCILDRAPHGARFTSSEWWQAVQENGDYAIHLSDLSRRFPKATIVFAANAPYVVMVANELAGLDERSLEQIRIVGLKDETLLSSSLRRYVMPYDNRLNDPSMPLKGTEYDFPARALAHFVSLVGGKDHIVSAEEHARSVKHSLSKFSSPKRPNRPRLDDLGLLRAVKDFKQQGIAKSKALRKLRDEMGLACEQQRFSQAWINE